MTIKEALEACHGGHLREEYVDKVMNKIMLDQSEAIAIPHPPKSGDPQELIVREKKDNNSDEDRNVTYRANATWNDTTQQWKERTSGWSIKGGVGVEKYARGDIGFEYHRGRTEKDITTTSLEVSREFVHEFTVKPHSSCEVTVVKVETEYTADIKKLRLKFPHDTKLKIRPVMGPAGNTLLSEILEEKILYKKDKDDNTIVELDGKFKAMHTSTKVAVYPVSP